MKDWCINYFKNTRKYLVVICKTRLPTFRCTKRSPMKKYIWFICYILYVLHNLFDSEFTLTRVKAMLGNLARAPQERASSEAIERYSTGHHCSYSMVLSITETHLISAKLNFHLALLKFNTKKGKFWKIREWPNNQLECSKGNFKSTLIKYSCFNKYC